MSLVRGMARTAAIAGTATAVSNKVSKQQYNKWSQDGSINGGQPVSVAQPTAAPAAPVDPTITQLQELAKLKEQGILTEEEFTAKKKQILGI